MAALNARQVAAGVVGTALLLGLCSCSKDASPTAGATPSVGVEQTIAPTMEPVQMDVADLPSWWATDGDIFSSEYGVPAAYAPGYEFSETPQGAHEQWIYDNYPDYWAAGMRALAEGIQVWPLGWNGNIQWERYPDGRSVYRDENGEIVDWNWERDGAKPDGLVRTTLNLPDPGPAVMIQYYDGVRYEGTPALPLAFGTGDPMQPAPIQAGDRSLNYYSVSLMVGSTASFRSPAHMAGERGPYTTPDSWPYAASVRSFEHVFELIDSGEYLIAGKDIPEDQFRVLLPGEVNVHVSDNYMSKPVLPQKGGFYDFVTDTIVITDAYGFQTGAVERPQS